VGMELRASVDSSGLSLSILGAAEFTGDGADTASEILRQPKQLSLLIYLAACLPRGFHRRDELIALLWPESDASHGRNSLRQSLHVLRRLLPAGTLVTRGRDEVALSVSRLRLDTELFEDHLGHGREAEALALYRGDLLHGCHLADSPEYAVWLDAERERLRRRVVRGAMVLAKRSALDGDVIHAAEWARFAGLRAPYDEDLVHEVVDVLDRIGDRAGGARFYAAADERFRSELGIALTPRGEYAARNVAGRSARDGLVLSGRDNSSQARSRLASRATASVTARSRSVPAEARRMYLEARQYSAQRSPATISRSIEGFQRALRLAPDYAEAHAGIAFALAQATVYIGYPGCDTWPRIRTHASRALWLDPSLGEAHAMLAHATLSNDYDWILAERMYRHALELDPVSDIARQSFALYFLTAAGRTDEALEVLDQARDIMPYAPGINTFYAMCCVYGRQFERGRVEAASVLVTQPEFAQAHWVHGMALEGLGELEAAIKAFETGAALTDDSSLLLLQLGRACARAGHHERARQILAVIDRRAERAGPAAYYTAEVLAALGDTDVAIDTLYSAYRQRHPAMVLAGARYGLDPLREERRFRDLLMRLGIRSHDRETQHHRSA
jgi:DNA-binding SARP family transcriptional activator